MTYEGNSKHRHLPLTGSYNIRDVGGYTTRSGKPTQWRKLLRADSLHALTPAAQQSLIDYGVRTIVDLRRPGEVSRRPNVFAESRSVVYLNVPLFDDEEAERVDTHARNLEELYHGYLDHCQRQFRAILATLAAPGAGPALVHCMIGKDRTGLTIALALGSAEVPDETIAEDYSLSNGYLMPLLAEWRAEIIAQGGDTTRYDSIVQSPRETMLETLEYLRTRYGGVLGYLQQIGLSDAEIDGLRALILE